MSAKSQRVGKCIFNIHFDRTVSYIVQITFFIRHLISDRLVDQTFLKFFDTGDHFDRACRSQKMPGDGFGRVYETGEITLRYFGISQSMTQLNDYFRCDAYENNNSVYANS